MNIAQAYYIESHATRQSPAALANACDCTEEDVVEYLRVHPDKTSGPERAGLAVHSTGAVAMTGAG